jgi:hypothetical protein
MKRLVNAQDQLWQAISRNIGDAPLRGAVDAVLMTFGLRPMPRPIPVRLTVIARKTGQR